MSWSIMYPLLTNVNFVLGLLHMKRLAFAGAVIGLLMISGIAYWVYQRIAFVPQSWNIEYQSGERFACSYTEFANIENGLTENNVKSILGEPNQIIVKKYLSDYQFGQGKNESNIKSGWLYTLPPGWEGTLEIYFNSEGLVVGKNCGNG